MRHQLRLAIAGCGAITQQGYLPAFRAVSGGRCHVLVDVNKKLAEDCARQWKIPNATDDYNQALQEVDAVIVAVPNHLHASFTIKALEAGKAVLCEKPIARNVTEARIMIEASQKMKVLLSVAMVLRQLHGLSHIRQNMPWSELGEIERIEASYGYVLNWPLSSLYLFDREKAGGGTLIDQGTHLLDALIWVLQAQEVRSMQYADNGEGGIESEAEGFISLQLPGFEKPVECRVRVSRLRRLKNAIVVRGKKAVLTIPLDEAEPPYLQKPEKEKIFLKVPVGKQAGVSLYVRQLDAFIKQVQGEKMQMADGKSQLLVMKLIDACYVQRVPLFFPWQEYTSWR